MQNVLVGAGVNPTNIRFNGSAANALLVRDQAAHFTTNFNPTNLGLNAGILLTTGKASVALGPNNSPSRSITTSTPTAGDPDLALLSGQTIFNVAILDFDFVATGLVLNFDYVFASEEYPEYVNSVNDTFGFFLSGPGIAGPYSNGAKNIALVPSSTTVISINTVNNGPMNAGGAGATNPLYYYNNSTIGLNPNNSTIETTQYDGFTVPLRATSSLICGQTYHIKLAIANATDNFWDSGVFIKNFTIAPLQLVDQFGLNTNPDVCFGETEIINSGLTVGSNIFTWTFNGAVIPGQNGPSLAVTVGGLYGLTVTTPSGCSIASDTILIAYRPEIPVNLPNNITLCTLLPPPYTYNINQTSYVLNGMAPSDYSISYYNSTYQNAVDGSSTGIIPNATLGAYTVASVPSTVWIRLEETNGVGCVVVKPFILDVIANPAGTISYPSSPYCNTITTCQPITTTGLTSGGTYTSTPPGLTINPTTGCITPSTSTIGTYTVCYDIPISTFCPAYNTCTTVQIANCGSCTVTATNSGPLCPGGTFNLFATPVAGATYAWTGPNGFVSGVQNPVNVPAPTTPPFIYTVTATSGANVCTSQTTVVLNPAATIALTSAPATTSQSVCINTAITNIVYTTANGATGATAIGLPAGVTGSYAFGVLTISGSPNTAGTFPYTVTTSGGCGTASLTGTIIVNPNVTISLTSAPATTSQVVCINTAITNIVYTTANGATGATVAGLPAGVTGAYAGGVFTISGTPSAAGTFPYTVTTTGGCGAASLSGTITVNPNVTIALTSAPATTSQVVCINTAITNIVYTTANGATGATVIGLPTGVTGAYVAGVFTISGTPSVAGTYPYTVTTTGGCSTASLSGTITVSPNTTISLTSAPATATQSICTGSAITNVTYAVANGATGATVIGLPTGVTGVFAAGVFTISGTPSVTGTFPYTVTTTGGCSSASSSGSITIGTGVTLTLTSAPSTTNQTLCTNTAITNITYAVGGGAIGATVSGLPAGITGTFAGGVFTISGSTPTVGTYPYTVTTSGGCLSASLSGTIQATPGSTIALTSAPVTTTQSVCISTAIANIVYTTANGATGAAAIGLPTGVTGSYAAGVFTISGTPSVAGVFPYTVTTSGGCGTASLSGTITVSPNVTLVLTSAASTTTQTVCINTIITNIVYTTANGATGATVTPLPAGVTGSYAGGVFTISGTPTLAGAYPYTVTTTGG